MSQPLFCESTSSSTSDAEPRYAEIGGGRKRVINIGDPIRSTPSQRESSKKQKKNEEETNLSQGLTKEQKELVSKLLKFQKKFESYSDDNLKNIPTPFPMGCTEADKKQRHRHLQEIISQDYSILKEYFARMPGHFKIHEEDRQTLYKAGLGGLLLLRWAGRYNRSNDTARLVPGRSAYSRNHLRRTQHGGAADALFDFFKRLHLMDIDDHEFALLHATIQYTVCPDVKKVLKRPEEVLNNLYKPHYRALLDVALQRGGPRRVWEMQAALNDCRTVARKLVKEED